MQDLAGISDSPAYPTEQGADEKIARLKSLFPTTRSGATGKDTGGVIRFDLCLRGTQPTDAPRSLYLDHAIVHETSDS